MSYSEWTNCKISDLGDIVSGGTPSTKNADNWDGDISWITPKDLSGYKNRYISTGERKISDKGLANSSARLMPKGSILFSSRAPIGYVAIASKELTTNQGFKSIVPNNHNFNIFIYYLLKYITEDIKNVAGGSTFSEISGTAFKNIDITIPKLSDQKAIANILSSLDDKIELNNKINKNLEELAQTLYKRWFVDFEFPNENGEPYKSSGGEMVESELGLIPKGWLVDRLSNYAEVERGLSYKGKYLSKSGVPMINLGSIRAKGGYNYDKIKYYDGEYKARNLVQKGDIIIANTDMTASRDILGTPIIVPSIYVGDVIFSHHLYALRQLEIRKSYLYYYLKSEAFKKVAENYANGTTVLAIAKKDVGRATILISDFKLVDKFSDLVDDFLKRIATNERENISTARIRDELLPKLMNGEIEVPIRE